LHNTDNDDPVCTIKLISVHARINRYKLFAELTTGHGVNQWVMG